MALFVDQLERNITLNEPPKRIVSVVPSQTELLYDLGLEDRVVGITKFCIHPDTWFRSKTRVGGTKNLNLEVIAALNPDLILANKEENTKEEIEALAKLYPVWISDIYNLNDAYAMIKGIGEITNSRLAADKIVQKISSNFSALEKLEHSASCIYLIWKSPYMCAGTDTFINDLLGLCGFQNLIQGRYPVLTAKEIQKLNPEYILLSSEPYPFKEKHIKELQLLCPNANIRLVDGEHFSWYGSRLINAPHYFNKLLKALN
ncbi:MAG: ABC-type Fe3+-hydroxamate transport system substrate-binding protein [Candidatus Azotimanducaceae bacterium]|jgi:ABC-type Fe3+-hydroxamate transport system substrate-binding protein